MTMRIDAYNRAAIDTSSTSGTSAAKGAHGSHRGAPSATSSSSGSSAVKVTLSSKAQELSSAADSNGIDNAKVDRLKQAITSGTFKVDSDAIASRLVNEGE